MSAALTITFADEAWTTMYELLSRWADKGYVVDVNGRTYELIGLDDGFEAQGANLLAHPWDEDLDLPDTTTTVRIPLFDAYGVVAITKLHLH